MAEKKKLDVSDGVVDLVSAASNKAESQSHTFSLSGDLHQKSVQKQFLVRRGFSVEQNDVYPCLKEKDVDTALSLIWKYKVEAWWHYLSEYHKFSICTTEEFNEALDIE